ncbi:MULTISPECIES: prepilin peptidase [Streptomyces]|uniref:Prepilin peptidase n=1 Tax=Streptomyces thermoviolaceus subsp. thermoviolaceus TaxID=66860 RepID=A0ABX0YU33_STRTL|nr:MULTISPECIES: prepilin peptidase [Streptomyces]MCM3262859.1 prepilin peptidase [Streptomyces thermoviolaceus]NJP15943.1 prepilin peptidase [Streptomyces thermoviolaceus subsp. thermoviolaceus]RSR95290.1 prepilin peptidase [Streptomyces sp. WAC00469]WTD47659.1 prepilin peptidase [Streptomyces thermoviolaceus]GGV79890.1 prepilin peptidase [Streptomyces thermoviolaceus subsp. apingens]
MGVLLIAVAVVWGVGAGLLVPRAAHRFSVEAGQPWRAECPGGHPITGAFGGWVGRARCPAARTGGVRCAAYGPSTPVAAGVTAVVCAALAAVTGPRPEVAVWLLAAPVGVLLALVDQRVHRLPDVLTLPLAALTALLLGGAALLPAAAGSWPGALLGALALAGVYFLLFVVNPTGLGFGDVKLALGLGAALGWYGWPAVVAGGVAGLLYGGCYGLGLILLRRAGRGAVMPLGPFMLGGAFTGLLLGASAAP